MDGEYQILLDVWEADVDLDLQTLLANGVAGLICRLNDMEGGHHMDAQFPRLWKLAQQFPTQAIYFVYNPWVSGSVNFTWLRANCPKDYRGRMFKDTEVKYAGYSPDVYADNYDSFTVQARIEWPTSTYTGEWFLPTLAHWPVDEDYWWGAYPNSLNTGEHITWDELHNRLKSLKFAYNGAACPGGYGNVRLWQCAGGKIWLPGFGTHAVDVNVFPGSLDDLRKWMGSGEVSPAPVQPNYGVELKTIGQRIVEIAGNLPS
jgi:hypothetical protein